MALGANCVWEVETTGDDLAGGAYDGVSGVPGTDYTYGAGQTLITWKAAGGTYTNDLAATDATPSVLSSASRNFVAADVGNVVNLTAGTNLTAGRYRIASVAANQATLDRNCSSGGAVSGCTGYLGGAMATPKAAIEAAAASNTIHVKAATYTQTATITPVAGTAGDWTVISGYNAARGDLDAVNDYANFPVLQTASGSAVVLTVSSQYVHVRNLTLDGGDLSTKCVTTSSYSRLENLKAIRFTTNGIHPGASLALHCLVTAGKAGSAAGFYSEDPTYFADCRATANPCAGFTINGAAAVLRCVSDGNTGASSDGFLSNYIYGGRFEHCVAYGNGRDGFRFGHANATDMALVRNGIAAANTGYGIRSTGVTLTNGIADYNAFYLNTAGIRSGLPAGSHDVTLSGDPFTNAAGGDFSLNATAGAGAACRAAGFPGTLPGGGTVGYDDLGAVHHQDPAGAGVYTRRVRTGG